VVAGKGYPTQARTPDINLDDVIFTRWPCTIQGYPARGEPHSWNKIFEWCHNELGVHCRLHGRSGGSLPAELTLRGAYAAEAFKFIW